MMGQANRYSNQNLTATLWRKMRGNGDIRSLAQGSTATKWWSQDSTHVWVHSVCS